MWQAAVCVSSSARFAAEHTAPVHRQGHCILGPLPQLSESHWQSVRAGGVSPAVAWQLAMGAFIQLGLSLKHSFSMPASTSAMAAPEGTPSALLAPLQALQPLAVARMHANLLQLGYVLASCLIMPVSHSLMRHAV